jgi:hypothetical protein
MSHTEYSAQFVQYSSVFLGLEEALHSIETSKRVNLGSQGCIGRKPNLSLHHRTDRKAINYLEKSQP